MQMVEEEVNNIDMMGLSAREMEIIDLVADGLTNQEIAVKLTISTVSYTHLTLPTIYSV